METTTNATEIWDHKTQIGVKSGKRKKKYQTMGVQRGRGVKLFIRVTQIHAFCRLKTHLNYSIF